jgi:LAS superfamily LD-carboxypeptidase LdcB
MFRKFSIGILSIALGLLVLLFFSYGISGIYAFAQNRINSDRSVRQEAYKLITEESLGILDEFIEKKDEITLVLTGDIMMDRGVEASINKNYEGDFNPIFTAALPYLQEADIAFGNLEGQASDKGADRGKKYSFHMNPIVLEVLADAGFDVLSNANNHTYDWGIDGFEDTLARIKAAGMQYTGAGFTREEAETPTIVESHGIRVGFLAFTDVGPNWRQPTETQSGILVASDPRFEEIISNASALVDHLVVSIHWGDEYKEHNARQTRIAQSAIDAGADIIAGHHPHVEQATEVYNGGIIFYSLGNFVFDQYFSEETMQGVLAQVTLSKDLIKDYELFTSKQRRDYTIEEIIPRNISVDEPGNILNIQSPFNAVCSIANPTQEDKSLLNVGRLISADDYRPSGMINIRSVGKTMNNKNICLKQEAALSFASMQKAAEKLGLSILPISGYRSYEYQASLFQNWFAQFDTPPTNLAVAEPGHSEHQLGTTLDFASGTAASSNYEKFGDSDEYAWMINNAHLYGYVQSYQEGQESVTGYIPEAWHWRYLGVDAATEIKERGITIHEYLEE